MLFSQECPPRVRVPNRWDPACPFEPPKQASRGPCYPSDLADASVQTKGEKSHDPTGSCPGFGDVSDVRGVVPVHSAAEFGQERRKGRLVRALVCGLNLEDLQMYGLRVHVVTGNVVHRPRALIVRRLSVSLVSIITVGSLTGCLPREENCESIGNGQELCDNGSNDSDDFEIRDAR